jgi:hypothetical protein
MIRIVFLLFLVSMVISSPRLSAEQTQQYYEVRSYILGDQGDVAAIDQYLSEALLPALARQGIGPVGVLTNSENDQSGQGRIVVVIPYTSADQVATVKAKVEADAKYQADAAAYLGRDAKESPYQRIQSELLVAMDCMPQLKVPAGTIGNNDRVYELRVYESANERLGTLKVDMFNSGEVPIFLGSGIQPIFIGQALIGPQTPNLTYLTTYPDEEARNAAWKAFRVHPDWLVLKEVAKYKGTVSHIDKFILVPKSYSQM